VLEREEEITVGLPDGREVAATLVGRDPGSDLAVLRIAEGGPAAPEFAPEGSLRVGNLVLALGRPGGSVQASLGAVSAVGGRWRGRAGDEVEGFLRTDTTFFPGFSGGPLIDASGRMAGINSSHFRPGQGITIPPSAVTRIVQTLVSQGRIRRAYLGVGSQATRLPAALAEKVGGQESGLLIVGVEEGSPAGLAGLLVGDILVAFGDAVITDTDGLQATLGPAPVGAEITLRLLRGGEPHELSVTLGERG
jgi:S1-C subfamily serine protease